MYRYVILDTETTGLPPKGISLTASTVDQFPRMIQLAYGIFNADGRLELMRDRYIKPDNFVIPESAIAIHKVTNEKAADEGWPLIDVLDQLEIDCLEHRVDVWIGFNIEYDLMVLQSEHMRTGKEWIEPNQVDVMHLATEWANMRRTDGSIKNPKLSELFNVLFPGEPYTPHSAGADIWATYRCWIELVRRGVV